MEDLKEHIIYPLTVTLLFLVGGLEAPEPTEAPEEEPLVGTSHCQPPPAYPPPTAESLRREHEEWRRKQEENWANRPRYSPGDPEP